MTPGNLAALAMLSGLASSSFCFTSFESPVIFLKAVFVGIGVLVAAIPFVGPLIIKIVSIPIFWVLNALGTIVSGVAIKKGYATELAKGRIVTLGLLIGMIIGYILGHLIPLQ